MPQEDLSSFLRRHKPPASLQTALGFFNPAGMNIELLRAPDAASPAGAFEGLAALLHERMHWLQFVGTKVGLFSAYLASLQGALLISPEEWQREPLPAEALPLLDWDRTSAMQRTLWLACEQHFIAVYGGEREYFDRLGELGGTFQPEALSHEFRRMGSLVLRSDERYERAQEAFWEDARFPADPVTMLQHGGVGLGAAHLMEAAARVNEVFKRAEHAAHGLGPVVEEALFFPPYSYARDLFYEIVGAPPSAVLEMALCVLADWALDAVLPPLMPLTESFRDVRLPGPLFARLSQELDPEKLPSDGSDGPVAFAEELVARIYEDVGEKVDYPSPLESAQLTLAVLRGVAGVEIPGSLYEESDQPGYPVPADGVARLRYVTKLARDAAVTRLEHPSFFAFPYAHYRADRAFFHRLYDPIQPPLWSIGDNRFVPTRDDADWHGYFYIAAVQHEAVAVAAYGDVEAVADRLRAYRGTLLPAEVEDSLLRLSVAGMFGRGSASSAVLEHLGIAEPGDAE